MTIPICATENAFSEEPRRGSTFFIPTLRRALARRMWGQGLQRNKNVEDVQEHARLTLWQLWNIFDFSRTHANFSRTQAISHIQRLCN